MDYKHCNPSGRPHGSSTSVIVAILIIVAVFGWMGERDREHLEEIEFQRQMIDGLVSSCVITNDGAPAMEMGMPIAGGES